MATHSHDMNMKILTRSCDIIKKYAKNKVVIDEDTLVSLEEAINIYKICNEKSDDVSFRQNSLSDDDDDVDNNVDNNDRKNIIKYLFIGWFMSWLTKTKSIDDEILNLD